MYYQRLSGEEILSGFREGDADIIREYFYGYCQVGYNIFDQRYQLREKENMCACAFDGRKRKHGLRRQGLYQIRYYGAETYNTRVYHFAGAE
mgnify:CR=1 FL=1